MDILTKINWVDGLILIIIIRTSYIALQDGLSHEILPLVGSLCMLVLSLHYYDKIGDFLYYLGFLMPKDLLNLVGFIIAVVCVGVIFRLVKIVMDKIIKVNWHPLIERFGGFLAGAARGVITASIVLVMLMLIPISYLQVSVRDRSLIGMYFLRVGPSIYEKAAGLLHTARAREYVSRANELISNLTADKSVGSAKEKSVNKKK